MELAINGIDLSAYILSNMLSSTFKAEWCNNKRDPTKKSNTVDFDHHETMRHTNAIPVGTYSTYFQIESNPVIPFLYLSMIHLRLILADAYGEKFGQDLIGE